MNLKHKIYWGLVIFTILLIVGGAIIAIPRPTKSEFPREITTDKPTTKGHWHDGVWCAEDHGREPVTKTTPKSPTSQKSETAQLGTSNVQPVFGSDFTMEELLKRKDVQQLLAEADARVQKYIDNHPAFSEQAIADRKTLSEYSEARKSYIQITDDFHKEWKSLNQEQNRLTDIPLAEIKMMSKTERADYLRKLKSIDKRKRDHWKRRDAHKKTNPIFPKEVYTRVYNLGQFLESTDIVKNNQ